MAETSVEWMVAVDTGSLCKLKGVPFFVASQWQRMIQQVIKR